MRRFARENGLSLFFLIHLPAITLVGQSFAGQHKYNADPGRARRSADFVVVDTSPLAGFGGAVMENWQSEFLQFSLFILATIWLVQKGSNESKLLEDAGLEAKTQQQIGRNAPADAPRWAKARRLAHADLRELAPARR